MTMQKEQPLKPPKHSRENVRITLNIAWPSIVESFFVAFAGLVDSLMVSSLGSYAVAAVGLTTQPKFVGLSVFFAANVAVSALVARRRGEEKPSEANRILSTAIAFILVVSVILSVLLVTFASPIIRLCGSTPETHDSAVAYFRIIMGGMIFNCIQMGINSAQRGAGNTKITMRTNVTSNSINIIFNYLLIGGHFGFPALGIHGAALATVLSQAVSCIWVLCFLTGKKALLPMQRRNLRIDGRLAGEIMALGMSGFIMQGTNCLVQVVCNATLKIYGGDLYVGVMTVINSAREILSLPVSGITNGAQPVLGYNYGAKEYEKVREGIRFMTVLGILYTVVAWLLVILSPHLLLSVFTEDGAMIEAGVDALRLYFFGFFFMAFQFSGQAAFTALGYSRHAIFFSLLRKAVIVAPLTLLLPKVGFGVNGVFLAEPVSNAIGGLACFVTMYFTLYRRLKES